MQNEIDQTENLFKPQINSRSDKLAQMKPRVSVQDRLYDDAQSRISRVHMLSQQQESKLFTPAISQSFSYFQHPSDPSDFQQRQSDFLQKKAENLRKLQQLSDQDNLFQPKINTTSAVICDADPSRHQETQQQKTERMSIIAS